MSLLPKKPSIDQEFVKTASHVGYATVGRKLVGSVREYRAATIATPLLVLGEVVFRLIILLTRPTSSTPSRQAPTWARSSRRAPFSP